MRQFMPLRPERLPADYDVTVHTEEPIVEVKETKDRIVVSYVFPGFYLADNPRTVKGDQHAFQQVHIQSTGSLMAGGKPQLPSFGRYLQIPPDSDYSVKVEKGEPVMFEDVLVTPAQEQLTDAGSTKVRFEYDTPFYTQDTLYPPEVVEVTGPYQVEEYEALLVHVRPLQYNPAKRQLVGYGNITVTIEISSKPRARGLAHGGGGADLQAFGNLFLNPHKRRMREKSDGIDARTILIRPMPELLIIYADAFVDAAKKLALWKQQRGIVTQLAAISQVGNTVANIKQYIRTRRAAPLAALRYVLLIGDVDTIVSETIQGGFGGSNVTDYYYATQKDPPPNSSGPTTFEYPWLSIGRIPVGTATEASGVVDQIIAYEKTPPVDPQFYRRMVIAAFFEDDDVPLNHQDDRGYMLTMEEIRPILVSLGYDVERVYTSNDPQPQYFSNGTPIPPDVKAAIVSEAVATAALVSATSEGQLIVGHRDHGAREGWYEPPFTVTDLDKVTGTMPTVFFSVNCLTGQFDYTQGGKQVESFAEKLLRMPGTAPSLIAATRVSSTYMNNHLIKALYDALFAGVLPTFPSGTASYPLKWNRLGDILNYAKSYLPIAASDTATIKDEDEIYHVIGDPTLELWTRAPLPLKVQAKMRGSTLDVTLSECPSGCTLTIWYKGGHILRLTPQTTHVVVPLKGLVPIPPIGPLPPLRPRVQICCWAPGYHYTETSIPLAVSPFPVPA